MTKRSQRESLGIEDRLTPLNLPVSEIGSSLIPRGGIVTVGPDKSVEKSWPQLELLKLRRRLATSRHLPTISCTIGEFMSI